MDANPPLTILLVEDDDIHAHLVMRSLSESPLAGPVHRVTNGFDALQFLRRAGQYTDAPTPDMVLLDLNLPKTSGHDVLAVIKQDPQLRVIPVVVMTTSRDELDRAKAYSHHANSYIVKPADFQQFRTVIAEVSHYWGTCNERPISVDL